MGPGFPRVRSSSILVCILLLYNILLCFLGQDSGLDTHCPSGHNILPISMIQKSAVHKQLPIHQYKAQRKGKKIKGVH